MLARLLALAAMLGVLGGCHRAAPAVSAPELYQQPLYEDRATRDLVTVVDAAASRVQTKGEAAFPELRVPGSRFRHGDAYVFVLDTKGDMLVHPDPQMEGKNEIDLKDVEGRSIVRGLIEAASMPGKPTGWYHYQWSVPDGILPRWKSSYVRLVTAPSGERYVVGSGAYDDRMDRSFVVDMVRGAVSEIERRGNAAYPLLRDPRGPFFAKGAYVFVVDPTGVELVNPAFPALERRNLLDVKDTQGKLLVRDMLDVVRTRGSGWVDSTWPKPGESVATRKSTFVAKAKVGGGWVLVGCGVYLPGAPKSRRTVAKPTAPELMGLVRDAAAVLEQRGADAFSDFRRKGTKWFHDDTYLFVWAMDGTRVFHAADPAIEGEDASDTKDIRGRPVGRMFLDVAASPSGEGWVHGMHPEPGSLLPSWRSSFVKRVTFPSGEKRLVGCGIYDMPMSKPFVEDAVNRAAALVARRGEAAFPEVRDVTGPFVFIDTYVFVDGADGTELVNPVFPSLEGKYVLDRKDATGKEVVREYVDAALEYGDEWVTYSWYALGSNSPKRKDAYVRSVPSGSKTYVVGAGYFPE